MTGGRTVLAALAWLLAALATVSTPPTSVTVSAETAAAAAADLGRVYRDIMGTAEEYRASELVNYHRIEGGVAACMARHGRPYRKPPFVAFYRDFTDAERGFGGRATVTDPLYDPVWLANELASARMPGEETLTAAYHGVPSAREPSWGGVLNGCRERYDNRTSVDVEVVEGAPELSYDLESMVGKAAGHPAVRASARGYGACMRSRLGVAVPHRDDFVARWGRFPPGGAPRDGRPPSAEWLVAAERHRTEMTADGDCRRRAYEVAMALVAERLPAWERAHRTEIDAVRARWRERVAAAERLS